MKVTYRVALMLGLVAFGAVSVEAAEIDPPSDDGARLVNIVNNFVSPVRVFAQDAEGRLHPLGNVARGQFKTLEVSEQIVDLGAVRIKVYPYEPARGLMSNADAIRTREIDLRADNSVTLWLETDLTASMVEIRG